MYFILKPLQNITFSIVLFFLFVFQCLLVKTKLSKADRQTLLLGH